MNPNYGYGAPPSTFGGPPHGGPPPSSATYATPTGPPQGSAQNGANDPNRPPAYAPPSYSANVNVFKPPPVSVPAYNPPPTGLPPFGASGGNTQAPPSSHNPPSTQYGYPPVAPTQYGGQRGLSLAHPPPNSASFRGGPSYLSHAPAPLLAPSGRLCWYIC